MTESVEPPSALPLFPIRGCILPPGEHLPLNVFEPRYLNMVDDAMAGDRYLGMIQPVDGGAPDRPALARVGTAGRIVHHAETEDGRYLIVLEGVMRFALSDELQRPAPYRIAQADYTPFTGDFATITERPDVDRAAFLERLKAYFDFAGIETDWEALTQAPLGLVVNKTAMAARFAPADKQALLEAVDLTARTHILDALMADALHAPPDGL